MTSLTDNDATALIYRTEQMLENFALPKLEEDICQEDGRQSLYNSTVRRTPNEGFPEPNHSSLSSSRSENPRHFGGAIQGCTEHAVNLYEPNSLIGMSTWNLPGGKGWPAGASGWQPHSHLWTNRLENVGAPTSHSPMGLHRLLQG
jgi:hypothetical protein